MPGTVASRARLKAGSRPSGFPMPSSAGCGMYEAERNEGEEFIDYAARVGTGALRGRATRNWSKEAEINLDNMLQLIHWSRRDPYKVVRGEGECAL